MSLPWNLFLSTAVVVPKAAGFETDWSHDNRFAYKVADGSEHFNEASAAFECRGSKHNQDVGGFSPRVSRTLVLHGVEENYWCQSKEIVTPCRMFWNPPSKGKSFARVLMQCFDIMSDHWNQGANVSVGAYYTQNPPASNQSEGKMCGIDLVTWSTGGFGHNKIKHQRAINVGGVLPFLERDDLAIQESYVAYIGDVDMVEFSFQVPEEIPSTLHRVRIAYAGSKTSPVHHGGFSKSGHGFYGGQILDLTRQGASLPELDEEYADGKLDIRCKPTEHEKSQGHNKEGYAKHHELVLDCPPGFTGHVVKRCQVNGLWYTHDECFFIEACVTVKSETECREHPNGCYWRMDECIPEKPPACVDGHTGCSANSVFACKNSAWDICSSRNKFICCRETCGLCTTECQDNVEADACKANPACLWSEKHEMCNELASCKNGLQDGDEEGVDCGGSCPDTPCDCMFRATQGCNPDNPFAPEQNHSCNEKVPEDQFSGYCDCGGAHIWKFNPDEVRMFVYCDHPEFTCFDVCAAKHVCENFNEPCDECTKGDSCIVAVNDFGRQNQGVMEIGACLSPSEGCARASDGNRRLRLTVGSKKVEQSIGDDQMSRSRDLVDDYLI